MGCRTSLGLDEAKINRPLVEARGLRGEARPLIAQHVMGGHGGLNILGQKSWNVYGQEQRAKVRRDEEEFAASNEDPDAGAVPVGASGPAPRPAGHVGELPTAHHVTLAGHEGPVLAARFSRGGSYALTCGKDRTFRLWNPFRGTLIKTYEGHAHEVRDVACAADNSRLATCGGDKQVFLWDVSTGQKIRRFRGHESAVNAVTFAAEDQVVITAGYDRSVRFFDCRSNSADPIQSVVEWSDAVTCVVTHGGGCRVTGGGVDGSVKTLDVRAGRIHSDDLGHPVTSLAVSGDGQCLLVGMLDGRMCLLDASDGSVMSEYRGHVSATAKVDARLTLGDGHVVAGSEDGRVVFWELVDARVEVELEAHPGKVVCGLDYHPKRHAMVTSATDGTAKVWLPEGVAGTSFD